MSDSAGTVDATGAFGFLIARTVRNRLAAQIKRVKSPRYAFAVLFGIGYLWLVFLRPGGVGTARGVGTGVSTTLSTLAGIGLTITLIYWWLRGGVQGALAFQPAEVQFLFTAPVSRRGLLVYKMVRGQIVLLINAVIWSFLIRRWGISLSGPERFATAWGFFTILSLHRLGTALVQLPPVHGARRAAWLAGKLLAAAAIVALAMGAFPVLQKLGQLDFFTGIMPALKHAMDVPPMSYALAPVRLVIAPLTAGSGEQWASAFVVVLGIVALHVVWILSVNVPFEEAATAASADLAKRIAAFKDRRAGGSASFRPVKVKRTWLPLAPLGRPAVAITWKNTLAMTRGGSVLAIVLLFVFPVILARMTRGSADSGIAVLPFAIVAVFGLIMGPRVMRNDLRQDLLNLPLLKTYPLSGGSIVLAEMASPILVLTVFECLVLAVGYFMLPETVRTKVGVATAVVGFILIPLAVLAVNAVSIGIQNGAAVLFPSWVRLGADSGGVEAMGQNLLLTFGSMLALILTLVIPVGVTVVAVLLGGAAHGAPAIALAGVVAISVLAGEIWWMINRLGRAFEKMDPAALT